MRSDVDVEHVLAVNRAFHDQVEAATYDVRMGVAHESRDVARTVGELERVLGRPLPAGAVVLDVGAGTGNLSVKLALDGRFREVIATDISEGMLARTRAAAQRHGVVITTRIMDGRRLPMPDGSVDLVVGCAVLHHVPLPVALMSEVARVLRPGGACIFIGEPSEAGEKLTRFVKWPWLVGARLQRKLVRRPARWIHEHIDVHCFTPDDVRALTAHLRQVRFVPEGLLEPIVDQGLLAPVQYVFGRFDLVRSGAASARRLLAAIDKHVLMHVAPKSWLSSVKFAGTR